MKLLFTCLLCCCLTVTFAQRTYRIDSTLKFDQPFTKCERKWVVVEKSDSVKKYFFGFIYVDLQAGFTFDLAGRFRINKYGKYVKDSVFMKNKSVKFRLPPNWKKVALLPPSRFDELQIPAEPKWLHNYYQGADTSSAEYCYRRGFIYNAVNDYQTALIYLIKAKRMNPHPPGIDFEMGFAYNGLGQYNEAIKVLKPFLLNEPPDPLVYKEVGYAYFKAKDYNSALTTYKKGLSAFPDTVKSDIKGEMAFNMANVYKAKGSQNEYQNWMAKAKHSAPGNSNVYRQVTAAGF